jgi:hypothetical protein
LGLKTKEPPPELESGPWEVIWPGDTAVDVDASNLSKWVKEGGKAGLVLNGDEKPDVIWVRRLSPSELQYVQARLAADPAAKFMTFLLCFQIGVTKIEGLKFLREETSGIQMMARRTLDKLMASHAMELENAAGKVMPRSLPDVVGEQIFAASFRS